MRPVQIDFVAPRAWKFIWAAGAVVVLAVLATSGAKLWQLRQQRVALEQQLTALQAQQLQRLAQTKTVEPSQGNPRAASEAMARRLLQRDWNRLYDAIETPALAKVRLVQLNMDAVTGQAMLEYALESMAQVAEVTQALNRSGSGIAWRLERLDSGGQTSAHSGAPQIKGVWRAEP